MIHPGCISKAVHIHALLNDGIWKGLQEFMFINIFQACIYLVPKCTTPNFSHTYIYFSNFFFCFRYFFSPLPENLSSSCVHLIKGQGLSWWWPYGSWSYKYLCNQRLLPLLDKTLCDQVCHWLATGRWFSPGPPLSSTNKSDRHDITEILLKVALNTTKKPKQITNNLKHIQSTSLNWSLSHRFFYLFEKIHRRNNCKS